jgi:uncharacterized membrane protein YvlD (DUF360 family)
MTPILPSLYGWLLPYSEEYNSAVIDLLASNGEYPSLNGLILSIPVTILFGIFRLILQHFLFNVSIKVSGNFNLSDNLWVEYCD